MRENSRNDERGEVEDGKELSSRSRKSRQESTSEAVETERSMPAIREQESGEGSARRWRATVGLQRASSPYLLCSFASRVFVKGTLIPYWEALYEYCMIEQGRTARLCAIQ